MRGTPAEDSGKSANFESARPLGTCAPLRTNLKKENAPSCFEIQTAGLLINGTLDKSEGLRGFHLAVDRPLHAVVSLF